MTVEDFVAYRKKLGLTQTELAKGLGMSLRAVQEIENGRAKLRSIHSLAIDRLAMRRCAFLGDATALSQEAVDDVRELNKLF